MEDAHRSGYQGAAERADKSPPTESSMAEHTTAETTDPQEDAELKGLSPLANQIVDRAIDNMMRKLVAGYRNKNNAKPNAKKIDIGAETKETLDAVSARSVMEVANRGQAWKEMIQKSLSRGISSIATIDFDGQFKVAGGQRPADFKDLMPNTPGVYVVFDDRTGNPVYVGDSEKMQSRWNAGHFNEYGQGQRPGGERYKLADELEAGCTIKFIRMDTKETAAALEAHLIKENFDQFRNVSKTDKDLDADRAQLREKALADGMLKNKRGELETEQGTRSNQEAKKLKDAAASAGSLALSAGGEALKNGGYDVLERLTSTIIKAVKDELVDILRGGKSRIAQRIKRLLSKVFAVLKDVCQNAAALLRGLVEFIVNALSKTISQIYNLARNIFDLATGAWQLYRGAETMTREELVRKVSETIITSGTLVMWEALDPILEAQLAGVIGPFAPYVSAAIVAVGFGLSSYALQSIVTKIIDAVVAFKQGVLESLDVARVACEQLIRLAESELQLMSELRMYVGSSLELMGQLHSHTQALTSEHQAIQPLDLKALAPTHS